MTTKEITIAGQTFAVLQPYAEGHTITEAEAKALNQVRAENVRNNMAGKVKAAAEGTAAEVLGGGGTRSGSDERARGSRREIP